MSLEQIAASSGRSTADVQSLLTADALYSAACSLNLDKKVLEKVANPRTFPLTVVERAFESKPVRDFFGVERDERKIIKGTIKRVEFEKGFSKVVEDAATGKINTRSLNNTADIKKYLGTFGNSKPNLAKKGKFEIRQLIKGASISTKATLAPKAKKKVPRQSQSVIPSIISCTCASNRIRDVFAELRSLRLEKYPNATALLLRTLIDLCVSNYLDKTGEMKPLLARFQKKGKPTDWAPSLHQMLEYLLQEMDCGLGGQALRALRTFNSSRKDTICLDGLDSLPTTSIYRRNRPSCAISGQPSSL
jgi:hypothetical protein